MKNVESTGGDQQSLFMTTQWSVVLGWSEAGGEDALRCLGDLCESYWRPLYRYARRKGNSPSDAEDLVQGFFEGLMSREGPVSLDREKGKFRAYLLAGFKKHMAGVWRRGQREKRGGGSLILSLNWESEETGRRFEVEDGVSPDVLFDRDWARVLLDGVLDKMEAEFSEEGKIDEFKVMRGFLAVGTAQVRYSELAETLAMSEGAARVAVHRLRKRYRNAVRREVATTLSSEEAVDEEMQVLFLALTEFS